MTKMKPKFIPKPVKKLQKSGKKHAENMQKIWLQNNGKNVPGVADATAPTPPHLPPFPRFARADAPTEGPFFEIFDAKMAPKMT